MSPTSLFVSHGAPTLALDDSPTGRFLDRLGGELPRPRAIVVASAHFTREEPTVSGGAAPATIHDFGGFPAALYDLRYPAPGDPALAQRIVAALVAAGIAAKSDPQRGFDHGVWVPLIRMFPQAGIPVVALSVSPDADAAAHFAVGRALAWLRDEGVLLIGSGGFVHNLGELEWGAKGNAAVDWARAFADWLRERLLAGDAEAALDWRTRAPTALRSHPTPEHLLPLFVAFGAAGAGARATLLHQDWELGTLALDSYGFA